MRGDYTKLEIALYKPCEEVGDSVNMESTKGLNGCVKNGVGHSLQNLLENFPEKKYPKTQRNSKIINSSGDLVFVINNVGKAIKF